MAQRHSGKERAADRTTEARLDALEAAMEAVQEVLAHPHIAAGIGDRLRARLGIAEPALEVPPVRPESQEAN